MTTHPPLVSVVMAVRNGEPYLSESLASVRAQTYPNVEVLVVDGASSDRSVAIAEELGARVLRQTGTGLARAWNQGIEAAGGELIAMLDSDDLWEPEKLEAQVKALSEQPELDCVIGTARYFLQPGFSRPAGMRPDMFEREHASYMPGALMARRSLFDKIGMFPADFAVAMDVDWFARLKDSEYRLGVVQGALTHKRFHATNVSVVHAERGAGEIVRLLRESIARQREVGPK